MEFYMSNICKPQRKISYIQIIEGIYLAGGRIERTINTENYVDGWRVYGIKVCDGSYGPSSMIQANNAPGECWAFKGSRGRAIIKLRNPVKINAVTLEHIPKYLSPSGNITSAPRDFRITGSKDYRGRKGKCLGHFKYNINGKAAQLFPVNDAEEFYDFVDFEVLTNHGNEEFTCVYRLQIHGQPLGLMNKN